MLGLVLLVISSTLALVMPYSSASSMAFSDQRTTLNHCSSPWRTMGPSGSLEKPSGRITYLSGFSSVVRVEASCDLSVVKASQRPAEKARMISSYLSITTGLNSIFWPRNQSARFSSVVVPGCTQMVAPFSSLALLTFRSGDHHALAVVVVHAHADQAQRGVARQRDGGVAGQHVDLAGLQRGEALLRVQRRDLDLAGVAEHGGGDGAAQVHVQALPFTLAVRDREPRNARGNAALYKPFLLDVVEGRARMGSCGSSKQGGADSSEFQYFHRDLRVGESKPVTGPCGPCTCAEW